MAAVTITAASVVPSAAAIIENCIAGGTITAGQPVYINSSGQAITADADGSNTWTVYGIALNGAGANQIVRVCRYDTDFTPGFTLVPTAASDKGIYCLGAVAGTIVPVTDLSASWRPVILMVAKSASKAYLNIIGGAADSTALA